MSNLNTVGETKTTMERIIAEMVAEYLGTLRDSTIVRIEERNDTATWQSVFERNGVDWYTEGAKVALAYSLRNAVLNWFNENIGE